MSLEVIISLLAAIGIGGILAILLNRHFDQQKSIIEHDVKIFNQSNKILPEQKLSKIIDLDLDEDHSIYNDDLALLINWCMFFDQTGNQYIDKRIVKANQKMVMALNRLTDFVSSNSAKSEFQDPSGDIRYVKPRWDIHRKDHSSSDAMPLEYILKHEEFVGKLRAMTLKVRHQYREYRLSVKQRLKI